MGTIQHHQSRCEAFLRSARHATAAADAARRASPQAHNHALAIAADALRRAASHAVTALAVHNEFRHNTTKRLHIALTYSVCMDELRRGSLKTFRHIYILPTLLDIPTTGRARPDGSSPRRPRVPDGYHGPMTTGLQTIRRMRRRVASLKNAINALIAGRPKPVRPAKRFLRVAPEDLPETTSKYGPIRYVGEIMRLPNFESVRRRYGLTKTPMSTTESDTAYRAPGSAASRRLCRCAPEPRHTLGDHDDKIILVPEWRAALTDAYPHLKLPLLIPF